MYVKVRTVDGKTNITLTISKLTTVEDFRELVERKLDITKEKQRFFYRGKQLEDGYKLFDYDVKLNDVIQLMIKTDIQSIVPASKDGEETKSCKVSESENNLETTEDYCLSKYFKIGDLIDIRSYSYGSWFEGKIVGILRKKDTTNQSILDENYDNNVKDLDIHDSESNSSADFKGFKTSDFDSSDLLQAPEDDGLLYQVIFEGSEDEPPTEVPLENVRPRARHKIDFSDLRVNDLVLANYNIEEPNSRGYWYDVRITSINKTRTKKEIIGSICSNKTDVLLHNCKILFCDEILKIERVKLLSERNSEEDDLSQAGSSILRQSAPNCTRCKDNPRVKCKECSCHVCGGKDDPASQILCDECNMAFHLRCLNPPLERIPDEDEWYCPDCKNDENEIVKAGEKLKESKRKSKLPSNNTSSTRDWGKGMACVGRTKECTLVPSNHYGPIPGVEVGTSWLFRVQVSETGIHRPPVGGIHGRESDGAYSIVLSGGYEDDVDNGEEFVYTGSGGRDLSGNKRTADQSCDQTLTRLNKALALNCNAKLTEKGAEAKDWKGGKPVRVVRNYKLSKHSKYAPVVGNRYDGIYKVVKYYPEKGKSGFVVWRYILRRDDNTPAPWTSEGKKFIKLHGLENPQVPEGYLEAKVEENEANENDHKNRKSISKKRSLEIITDSKLSPEKKKVKTVAFKLEANVEELIAKDENTKIWESCKDFLIEGKQKYIAKVAEMFMCICCQELVFKPITTTCKHNICKNCLQRSFAAEVYTCPCCRFELGEKYKMDINETLASVLRTLFPGYENGR